MTNPLMDLIGSGEGDYNSYNRGTITGKDGRRTILPANGKVEFSVMTVEEIKRRQLLDIVNPDRLFAVGRYQFIKDNFFEAVKELGISNSALFNPELQDRLFNEYLLPRKRWQVHHYITEKSGASLRDAQKVISKEWASVEDPDNLGHVYAPYERQGNKMHTRAAQIAIVLDEMRADYKQRLEQGMSPKEAWSATTTMGPSQHGESLRALSVHGRASRAATHTAMRLGARGPSIGELQSQLGRLGYKDGHGQPLSADGHFGDNTRRAVEAFQRDHALTADGIAGRATLAAVHEAVRVELRSIGQRDAEYLREERDETLSAYRDLPQEVVSRDPYPGITAPTPKADALQAAALDQPDNHAIRTLQQNLNTLGVTDMQGQRLTVHGVYDDRTLTAVARFQSDQGLPVTGLADDATLSRAESRAFIADMQQVVSPATSQEAPRIELARPYSAEPESSMQATPQQVSRSPWPQPSLDDPRQPDSPTHALYREMQRCFPDASEERHLQFTSACHVAMIDVGNLRGMYLDEEAMTVDIRGSGPLARPVTIDMTRPPPEPEQAIQSIQQFDQREMLMMQEIQTQNIQMSQSGPRM